MGVYIYLTIMFSVFDIKQLSCLNYYQYLPFEFYPNHSGTNHSELNSNYMVKRWPSSALNMRLPLLFEEKISVEAD
jgi:hypothetical protein